MAAAAEPTTTTGASGYELVRIPAGKFVRGCTPGQADLCHKSERPAHPVTVGHDLWVGRTEVTQALYAAMMGDSPHKFDGCGDTCPVETVSWFDAVRLANALPKKGLRSVTPSKARRWSGRKVPMHGVPTAHRGRVGVRRARGPGSAVGTANVDEAGWTVSNAKGRPHPVGALAPNGYGLYDMVGNVWEMDLGLEGQVQKALVDPMGPSSRRRRPTSRASRWVLGDVHERGDRRHPQRGAPDRADTNTGVRLVRTAVPAQ